MDGGRAPPPATFDEQNEIRNQRSHGKPGDQPELKPERHGTDLRGRGGRRSMVRATALGRRLVSVAGLHEVAAARCAQGFARGDAGPGGPGVIASRETPWSTPG
jgi:hypothetical protein